MARATWYGNAVTSARPRTEAPALPPYRIAATGALTECQGKALLAMLGIAVPEGALARDPDDAREIAMRVGYPVVLKAQAAALAHKSEAGGVVLNIADDAALMRAWHDIAADVRKAQPDLVLDGMLVEAMAPPGIELVLGARREPGWGPILTVGLGGIWIEALHDIRILPADLDREGIVDELRKLKGAVLFAAAAARRQQTSVRLPIACCVSAGSCAATDTSPKSRSIRCGSTPRVYSRSMC